MPRYHCADCRRMHDTAETPSSVYCYQNDAILSCNELDAYAAALPQGDCWAFYAYEQEFTVRNSATYVINHEGTPNVHQWLAYNPFPGQIAFAADKTIYPTLNAAMTALSNHRRDRTFTSDGMCASNLPAGITYAGKYIPVILYGNSWSIPARALVINQEWIACAHCAYKQAHEAYASGRRPGGFSTAVPRALTGHEWYINPILNNYSGEIIGDTLPEDTTTVKDVTEPIARSCGNCGRVGHRSDGCTYPEKMFEKVGVEIEGRWIGLSALQRRAADGEMMSEGYQDGSVYSSPNGRASPWEFQTNPGSIREACQALVDFYPDETDKSCGMHVHVSMPAPVMTYLNSPSFFAYFKKRWEEWAVRMNLHGRSQFMQRLNGRNEFCRPASDRPYNPNNMDRYAQLNFSAFREHGTVECRLLPMFRRASLGVAAIQELLDIYETFLADPAAYGHPGFTHSAAFVPVTTDPQVLETKELEIPTTITFERVMEMELAEMPAVPDGHVRIAMPINQPITVQGLANAISRRAA